MGSGSHQRGRLAVLQETVMFKLLVAFLLGMAVGVWFWPILCQIVM